MKTLVVHPYDEGTLFLKEIYKDLDCTLINENVTESFLKEKIEEHDRIVLLGDGTRYGLYGYNRFIIDFNFVNTLKNKDVIYIWDNSNHFAEKYYLKGFSTNLILFNYKKASVWVEYVSEDMIKEANDIFCSYVKDYIEKGYIIVNDSNTNPLVKYNNDNMIIKT